MSLYFSRSEEHRFYQACRVLFGREVELGRDFLSYLQLEGIRSAYHSRAKMTHPDRFPGADLEFLSRQAQRFQRVVGAYDILYDFLRERERGTRFARDQGSSVLLTRKRRMVSPQGQPGRGRVSRPFKTTAGTMADMKLPRRRLPFGMFLYHQGLISYGDLAKALVWQRKQRPRLGDLSRLWGRLSEEQIRLVLAGEGRRFGEKAVAMGLLNQFQVNTMIHYQRSRQQPLGAFFVEQGLLSPARLNYLLAGLHEHNEIVTIELPWFRRFFDLFL